MKYKVLFEREVHTRETVERIIEAGGEADAKDQAFSLAVEFDGEAPADRMADAAPCETCDWTFTVQEPVQ